MRKLARWSARHRRVVVVAWLVAAIGMTFVGGSVGSKFNNGFTMSGTDSSRALALLQRSTPRTSGDSDQIVIAARTGKVTDPAVRSRVSEMLRTVSQLPHVGSVVSPYGAGAAGQISRSGSVEFATVTFDAQADKLPIGAINRVVSAAKAAHTSNLQVQLGGQAIERTNPGGTGGLLFGMIAALVVLLIVFGSLLAAALPLMAAGLALATGVGVLNLLSNVITMPDFATELALLIGLGVGVDYALFIVTRYRQALMRGVVSQDAIEEALDTSGRAVLFAGITVCIALLGMLALGVSILSGSGIAASVVVAFTVLAAMTLLPALLGFFGPRTLTRRARKALAAGALTTSDESPMWTRWAAVLQRRPAILAGLAVAAMLLIAVPVLSLRTGSADSGSDSNGTTTRQAYDLLAKGFGPGFNGPLQLVAQVSSSAQREQFDHVVSVVNHTRDVVGVTPVAVLGGSVATAQVFERGSPQDASTSDLVSTLRSTVIPAASQHRVRVLVAGQTAIFADYSSVLSGKLPLFVAVVVLLSFLLLVAVFRSLVIPLMAATMNLLSVAAAFGVVTAVFQWGWLLSLVGETRTGPIEAVLPIMVFAILFGLSMDYEVFLVSRIYEEWHRRKDNTQAVVHGLASTGRTITAAAAVMILVFGAFILGGEHLIKLFGVGLSAAILFDALIVRSILVPGLMLLIGNANWALPEALERIIPRLNVEGTRNESNPHSAAPGRSAEPEPVPVA